MPPFFDPGPIDHPAIPVFVAGVNPKMCRLAGSMADGLHAHPFHSRRYLSDVVVPAVAEGATREGRDRREIEVSSTVLVATGRDQCELDMAVEEVRQQIAFYASTPGYSRVMELHGWGDAREALSRLAARKRWDDMGECVTDDMVDTFALVCDRQQLPARLLDKYEGLLDRLTLYKPFGAETDTSFWADFARGFDALRAREDDK
jgi:probable F420-dependent oxidoreductase